jgi:hypothetical protein
MKRSKCITTRKSDISEIDSQIKTWEELCKYWPNWQEGRKSLNDLKDIRVAIASRIGQVTV